MSILVHSQIIKTKNLTWAMSRIQSTKLMASISPQQSHIVIIMVASFGECFFLEGKENLSLAEIQSLGAFKKPGISIGLMGLILDYPTDVHMIVLNFLSLCFLISPMEAARRWEQGFERPLCTHTWLGAGSPPVQPQKQLQRPLAICFAWLPSPCQSLAIITFISEQFGNYLETALFVLLTI